MRVHSEKDKPPQIQEQQTENTQARLVHDAGQILKVD